MAIFASREVTTSLFIGMSLRSNSKQHTCTAEGRGRREERGGRKGRGWKGEGGRKEGEVDIINSSPPFVTRENKSIIAR